MMKLSILIQAKEAVVAPVRRITTAIRGMVTTGVRDVARLDRMVKRLGETARNVGSAIGRTLRNGILAAGAAGTGLIASVIGTASSFEQFQVVLEGTEGSAEKARKAMAWVQNFAKKTPYELADVMRAFVQLRAYGIDPTTGTLESLGNAASGMNKDIIAAVEMLADAQTGEFERLKEFGVRAAVAGDKVTFSYMRAGKEVTKVATKNGAEIQKAIMGIFDERFAGMMDRQSRTLGGLWSNLKDMISATQVDIANAGFFAFVKGQLQQLLNWVNKLSANGQLQRWAKEVSDRLVALGRWLISVDWAGFARDMAAAVQVIGGLARGILWAVGGFKKLIDLAVGAVIFRISLALYGLATALGVVSIAGLPISAVVAVVGLLAYGAYRVMTSWSKVAAFFGSMWAGIKTAFANGVNIVWNALPAWMRGIFTGATFVARVVTGAAGSGSGGRGSPPRPPRPGAPPVSLPGGGGNGRGTPPAQVGGRLDIRLETDRGTRATVTRMSSVNRDVPIDVTRGRVVPA